MGEEGNVFAGDFISSETTEVEGNAVNDVVDGVNDVVDGDLAEISSVESLFKLLAVTEVDPDEIVDLF